MDPIQVVDIPQHAEQRVTLQGWLYNRRSSKKLHFIQLRDGSATVQCIVSNADVTAELFELAGQISQESALSITGTVKCDPRSPLGYEIHVDHLTCIHMAEAYPITKKAHGDAFLMEHRHLWLRSSRQHTILRIRHTLVKAIRDYFDNNGFTLIDSPILTPNACEGTSTLFRTPYFDSEAYLTQSGQLYQEAAAMAFGKSYCFGPTFRAEKSKTRRHLTEFWMVEPEVAFMDLAADMDLAEDFLCSIVARTLESHARDLKDILERDISALENVRKPFHRLTYDAAVQRIGELRDACADPVRKAELELAEDSDFGSPHETELTAQYPRPIIVHRFPTQCKAFYMKPCADNPARCLSMDVLAPEGYGEIIGGGQREEELNALQQAIRHHQLPPDAFSWFLDLRRYGSVPHAGFGLGLERTVAWVCGLQHVRETAPFARTRDRLHP